MYLPPNIRLKLIEESNLFVNSGDFIWSFRDYMYTTYGAILEISDNHCYITFVKPELETLFRLKVDYTD
jgi:hypothetical protein